jgi:hypothetical protein
MTDAPLPPTNHQSPITDPEDEISLPDVAIVLAKHKTLILGLPLADSLIKRFELQKVYEAKTMVNTRLRIA